MSTYKTEDFIGDFSNIESTSFRRKIYEACLLMSMEHYETLKKNYDQDRLPTNKYYTIADKTSTEKEVKVSTGPPKKKRNPVKKNGTDDELEIDGKDDADDEKNETKQSKDTGKTKKTYPIVFNKDAKTMFDFICGRFLWEIYSIDVEDDWPESKDEIVSFALKNAHCNFPNGNITKLIITSVATMNPSKLLPKSYGIDKEIRSKFEAYIDNVSVSDMVSTYLTGFLKLLCLYFTNRFWLEKTQTVNMKIFETVLRYIELTLPVDANTVSFGIIAEMNQYKELVNPPRSDTKTDKLPTKDKAKALPKKPADVSEQPKSEQPKLKQPKAKPPTVKQPKAKPPKAKPKSEEDADGSDSGGEYAIDGIDNGEAEYSE